MRAVLGLLFLMGGLTMGYLVLSGKFPNGGMAPPTTSTATPIVTTTGATSSQAIGQQRAAASLLGAGGPWGMSQAASYAYDLNAARGIQQS